MVLTTHYEEAVRQFKNAGNVVYKFSNTYDVNVYRFQDKQRVLKIVAQEFNVERRDLQIVGVQSFPGESTTFITLEYTPPEFKRPFVIEASLWKFIDGSLLVIKKPDWATIG